VNTQQLIEITKGRLKDAKNEQDTNFMCNDMSQDDFEDIDYLENVLAALSILLQRD